MPKISRDWLGEYNKSCSIIHNHSNKIEFAFCWFFYDFLEILQVSAIRLILLKMCFAPGPLGRFKTLQPGPRLALKSLYRNGTKQLGPRPWGRRGSADSSEADGAPGRAGERGGEHAHHGTVGTQNLGREAPYGGARRWPVGTAAVAATPASATHGVDHTRC
jgi:hypothetical protein